MAEIVLHLAMSIDGYIADENGGVDWLNDFMRPEEDYGMSAFFKTVGSCIMGSKTYEQALSFNTWFGDIEGIIFTTRNNLPVPDGIKIRFFSGDPAVISAELKAGEKDVWLVGGAKVITSFLNNRLIDRMVFTIVPRILGRGIPLFQDISITVKPTLNETKTFPDGVVQLDYSC